MIKLLDTKKGKEGNNIYNSVPGHLKSQFSEHTCHIYYNYSCEQPSPFSLATIYITEFSQKVIGLLFKHTKSILEIVHTNYYCTISVLSHHGHFNYFYIQPEIIKSCMTEKLCHSNKAKAALKL